jgi:predicted AlkP superfamily phosphohydrolase/phosphomutase
LKALVIGLDSASPQLIDKWIDRLPNLRSLRERGAYGILQSIVPPSSMPAWQCFATGKNPAKIGVWGFLSIGRDRQLRFGKTTPDIGCFWDLCSAAGLKVGVFNVPGTYPPYPVNGFMVSGFPTPPGKVWAYPASVMKRLDDAVEGYEVDVPITKPAEMRGGETAYLAQVRRLHDKSVESAKVLISWYRPDVFFMTLQGLDLVQHDFTRYMDRPDSKYANVVRDWYVRLDEAIGDLEKFSAPTILLTISDHGTIPISTSFHVNEFLRSNGFLTVKTGSVQKSNRELYTSLRRMILKTLPAETIRTIYRLTPDSIAHRLTVSAQLERLLMGLVDSIDWEHTKAFSTGGPEAAIYLNYDNPEVTADPRARTDLVQQLRGMFSGLTHPKTGEKIIPVFHMREETFRGPFAGEAPDMCVELFCQGEKIHVKINYQSGSYWSFSPHLSSQHVREGFWSMTGPGFQGGQRMDASILDMAPTLLNMLGVEVPKDCDGSILGASPTSAQIDTAHAVPLLAQAISTPPQDR